MIVKVYLSDYAIDSGIFPNPVIVKGEEVRMRRDEHFMTVIGDAEEYQIPFRYILYIAKIKE